jgi:hypothetical protein
MLEFKQRAELEKPYFLYMRAAREILACYRRGAGTVLFYAILSMLVGAGCLLVGIFFAGRMEHGTARLLSWGFWLMLALGMYVGVSGGKRVNRQLQDDIRDAGRQHVGFAGFFELYRRHYWPDGPPAGGQYQKFISLTSPERTASDEGPSRPLGGAR